MPQEKSPLEMIRVMKVAGLAKDSHAGARVERPHIRTKTYFKDEDIELASKSHPRSWPYCGMPGLAASQRLGIPLHQCNEAGIINLARCNMSCWYCFAGEVLDDLDAQEDMPVRDLFEEAMDQQAADVEAGKPWHILRITGGEPLLQQEELRPLLRWRRFRESQGDPRMYLWLDTNLGVMPTMDFIETCLSVGEPMGVVCCFKAFTDVDMLDNSGQGSVSLDDQFSIAFEWWGSGLDVYFYVIDATEFEDRQQELAESFIVRMRAALGPEAPLKTSVLEVNEHYACQSRDKPRGTILNSIGPTWDRALRSRYTPEEMLVLPHMLRRDDFPIDTV